MANKVAETFEKFGFKNLDGFAFMQALQNNEVSVRKLYKIVDRYEKYLYGVTDITDLNFYNRLQCSGIEIKRLKNMAERYELFVNCKFVSTQCRIVYALEGTDYVVSLPFFDADLAKLVLGVEISKYNADNEFGFCLLKDALYVRASDKNEATDKLTKPVFKYIKRSKIRPCLPSIEELRIWTSQQKAVSETCNILAKEGIKIAPFRGGSYWLDDKIAGKRSSVAIIEHGHIIRRNQKTNQTEARVRPVIRLNDDVCFFGHLNEFGVPSKDTVEIYRRMFKK